MRHVTPLNIYFRCFYDEVWWKRLFEEESAAMRTAGRPHPPSHTGPLNLGEMQQTGYNTVRQTVPGPEKLPGSFTVTDSESGSDL